jgi:thiamine biosynthesis lipoprotein
MTAMLDEARQRHVFRAMGTDLRVVGPDEEPFDDAIRLVEEIFEREEQRFSRFRPDSELSLVNARAGSWTAVSPPFAEVLRLALDGARESGGLFDPTVLGDLMAAGYDRDFSAVTPRELPGRATGRHFLEWARVEVRPGEVRLPAGVGLDFGGLAKGWTADLAAIAAAEMLSWAMVSAGGDLRVAGALPSGGVDVAVEDPADPDAEILRLWIEEGAVATSCISWRRWGPRSHHIIDPRTAIPATTGVVQATAWAETCALAEIRSTWALLAGSPALDRFPGVLVLDDGRVVTSVEPSADHPLRREGGRG